MGRYNVHNGWKLWSSGFWCDVLMPHEMSFMMCKSKKKNGDMIYNLDLEKTKKIEWIGSFYMTLCSIFVSL